MIFGSQTEGWIIVFTRAQSRAEHTRRAVRPNALLTKSATSIYAVESVCPCPWLLASCKQSITCKVSINVFQCNNNDMRRQMLCQKTGAKIVAVPVDDDGCFNITELKDRVTKNTKIIKSQFHLPSFIWFFFWLSFRVRSGHWGRTRSSCLVTDY